MDGGIELGTLLGTLLSTALVAAVPLMLAALGEGVGERAGLLNLGLEGMMLIGAFAGFWATLRTESVAAGLIAGVGAGLLIGATFGGITVLLRGDQILTGLAVTAFGLGLTGFLFRDRYGDDQPLLAARPSRLDLPLLSDLPLIGNALFGQRWVVYLAWLLVPLFAWLLARTRFGLAVRAAGERPFAADASGIDVVRVRLLAALVGGGMAGLAGATLTVGELGFFRPGVTVGLGFIAIAITMLGRWNPWLIFLGAVAFGALQSLDTGLQIIRIDVQTEFLQMLPYLGIILGLALFARRAALPAALATPYERE